MFFSLKQGEFVTYADGKDKKVQFTQQKIERELPDVTQFFSEEEVNENYKKIYREVRSICKGKKAGDVIFYPFAYQKIRSELFFASSLEAIKP